MKLTKDLKDAIAYSNKKQGNAALHLHYFLRRDAPIAFVKAIYRGEPLAHLFSQDIQFLREVGKRHGITRISIERRNTNQQHVELGGHVLREVLEEMGESLDDYKLQLRKR